MSIHVKDYVHSRSKIEEYAEYREVGCRIRKSVRYHEATGDDIVR